MKKMSRSAGGVLLLAAAANIFRRKMQKEKNKTNSIPFCVLPITNSELNKGARKKLLGRLRGATWQIVRTGSIPRRPTANMYHNLSELYAYLNVTFFDSFDGLHQYIEFNLPEDKKSPACKLTFGQGREDPSKNSGVFLQIHDQEANSIWTNPNRKSFLFPDANTKHSVPAEAVSRERSISSEQVQLMSDFLDKAEVITTKNNNYALRVNLPQVTYAMLSSFLPQLSNQDKLRRGEILNCILVTRLFKDKPNILSNLIKGKT